jgi:radical SAM superfamily enzyme YgiQ (UPF0313 family)
MKITFIRPSMTPGIAGDALEPLVFGILAGLTPANVELKLYDERIEAIDFDEPADLVALSFDTFSARRAYQVAAQYHRRGTPVVVGGFHPTLCADEALRYADAVVVGDAEDTWPQVVEDARQGNLQRVYRSEFPPLTELPVDRSIFAGKRYGRLRLVQFGRGCCHSCEFCSIRAFYGNRIRYRPVDEVIGEIETLNSRGIIFTDDNLFADKAAAVELLQRLGPLKVRWSCQAGLETAADESLLRLMAKSGCLTVIVGLESLNDHNLAQLHKTPQQTSGQYEEYLRRFHSHGIMVYGAFVFGCDEDTVDDFRRSLDFVTRRKLFLTNFNPLIPTPGTPLYQRLHAEGRLIRDPWWLNPDYRYGDAAFHPRGMTADELTAGCYWARTRFNRIGNIVRRSLNFKANTRSLYNTGAYFAVNYINRREIRRKQGLPLGHPDPLKPVFASDVR